MHACAETQFYQTFDMVKQSKNGDIRVIGRVDNSIRIKGVDWMPNEVSTQVVRYCMVIYIIYLVILYCFEQ